MGTFHNQCTMCQKCLRRRGGVPANRSERIDIRVRFAGGERRGKQILPKQ